jgi:outer membrane biosynthesis protein TonB
MAKKPNPKNIEDGWYRNIGSGPLSLGLVTFKEGQERHIPAQTRLKFAVAYDNAIKAGWLQGPTQKGAPVAEPVVEKAPEPVVEAAPEPVADVPTAPEPENEPVSEEISDDDAPKKKRRRRRKSSTEE